MSRKSDALGTGAIAFSPLVDILGCLRRARWYCDVEIYPGLARVKADDEERERDGEGNTTCGTASSSMHSENLDYVTSVPRDQRT